MKLDKKLVAAMVGVSILLPIGSAYAADTTAASDTAAVAAASDNAKDAKVTSKKDKKSDKKAKKAKKSKESKKADKKAEASAETADGYEYVSKRFGYKMILPQKPVYVLDEKQVNPDKAGEVLIFTNKEYDILYGWVVYYNDFSEMSVPDLNKMDDATQRAYLDKLKSSNPYEAVSLVDLNKKNKAVFAITAKTVEIDTDNDGIPDATATADSQNAEIIFRGNKGGRFRLELIDKPELRPASLAAFQKGAQSFEET